MKNVHLLIPHAPVFSSPSPTLNTWKKINRELIMKNNEESNKRISINLYPLVLGDNNEEKVSDRVAIIAGYVAATIGSCLLVIFIPRKISQYSYGNHPQIS